MPGQNGAKYVYSPKHLTDVFSKMHDTGRPDKLTFPYMRDTWLLKDAKYSAVLDLLRDMAFIDDNGTPTSDYAEYQNPSLSKQVIARGVRKAYAEFFRAYPNAQGLPKETIVGYFKQKTGAEKAVLDKIISTFTTLCNLGNFSDADPSKTQEPEQNKVSQTADAIPSVVSNSFLPITMNIQIVIPSDATAEQYDKIFSSLKKFLMK